MVVVAGWRWLQAGQEVVMPNKPEETLHEGAIHAIDSVQEAEQSALEAVRKFLDTVDGVFPDVGSDAGPRRKIIDSAFMMTEQLDGASNKLAQRFVKMSENALGELEKNARTPEK
jgi:hypothetical protein